MGRKGTHVGMGMRGHSWENKVQVGWWMQRRSEGFAGGICGLSGPDSSPKRHASTKQPQDLSWAGRRARDGRDLGNLVTRSGKGVSGPRVQQRARLRLANCKCLD